MESTLGFSPDDRDPVCGAGMVSYSGQHPGITSNRHVNILGNHINGLFYFQ
jgi:hypothetical protein